MIADANIGGAYVRRTFSFFGKQLKPNETLTRAQVLAIRLPNRRALIDANYIEVWPLSEARDVHEDVHIVHRGGGAYDVFAQKLNDEPLTKEEALSFSSKH